MQPLDISGKAITEEKITTLEAELQILRQQLDYEVTERQRLEVLLQAKELSESQRFESEQRYQRQAQEMSLLEQVRNALAAELDLPAVFRTVVEATAKTLGYTHVCLYLLEDKQLLLQHQIGYASLPVQLSIELGICGRVARTGIAAFVEDVQYDPSFVAFIPATCSEICVPLLDRTQVIGVFNIESIEQSRLTETDLRLVTAISEYVNLAIGRMRLYNEVQASEKQYRAVVDNIHEVVFQTDADGRLIFLNPAWEKITGFTVEESLGTYLLDYLEMQSPQTSSLLLKALQQHSHGSEYFRYEATCKSKDGNRHWLLGDAALIFDAQGEELLHLTGLLYDETERKNAQEHLRQQEQEYRALAENSPDVIARLDRDLRYLYINPAISKVRDRTPQDYLGKTYQEIESNSEVVSDGQQLMEYIFTTGQEQTFDYSLPSPTGVSYYQTHIVPELTQDGVVATILMITRDITELKQAAIALRQSETNFRLLFASNPLPILVYDLQNLQFLEVNDMALATSGYTRQEFLQLTMLDLCPPEDLPQLLQLVSSMPSGVSPIRHWRLLRKDKQILDIEVIGYPLEFVSRKARIIIAQDITARKQAEKALTAERELLAVTLRSIGEGVITTDKSGRISLLNPAAEKLTGWQQADALGQPVSEVLRLSQQLSSPLTLSKLLTKSLQNRIKGELSGPALLLSRTGNSCEISLVSSPILNPENEAVGVVLAFKDITEKQKLAEELLKSSKLESLGLLAGGVAHDFNNLLTAILTNLGLAKLELFSNEEAFGYLEDAEKASLRARDLTYQLLTFAKGGSPIKKTALLPEILSESAQFAMRGTNIDFQLQLPSDLWPVEVDKGQLSQVIQNLVINAVQAMPSGGSVLLASINFQAEAENNLSIAEGSYVKISVQDSGVGIPPELLPKIFDPYFTTKAQGNGLGLATTYSIIKRHDGHITVSSVLGIGTTFDIYLPAVPAATDAQPILTTTASEQQVGILEPSHRILVMDDDINIRRAVTTLLHRRGYEVEQAGDGAEMLLKYQEAQVVGQPFSAVIMDLTIRGGMGGKEAITQLLTMAPQVKAIVSSGYADDPVLSHFQEYGFKGAVVKPFRIEELTTLLYKLLHEG
jgi:PAS domain S-box-containing protein